MQTLISFVEKKVNSAFVAREAEKVGAMLGRLKYVN